ncbi:MAG: double-strand break repair helicase AddA [Hyphococcus sp.]|nr:MAG: double-strand break repair helicase AddA [Marinicaulis sp.]
MTPLEETTRNQRKAATPERSAFVKANAGAGKTRVLTNRVARLLLADVSPEKILCITFTKAAAAEMAERLFDVLGEWALAGDDQLRKALADLEGPDTKSRDEQALSEVRRLFARALETPGGLKIQTIHSFCEQVLKRFPLEADTPPGFTIIEDTEAKALLHAAIDQVALKAAQDEAIQSAFSRLALLFNEQDLRRVLSNSAEKQLEFNAMLDRFDGLASTINSLAKTLNADPTATTENIKLAFLNTLTKADLERAHEALVASGGNPLKLAPAVKSILSKDSVEKQWEGVEALFLTEKKTPRKKLTTKATENADPWAPAYLAQKQEAFLGEFERLKAQMLFENTCAYLNLSKAIIDEYNDAKATRAALDFDDLIARTRALFQNTKSAWVMYKLDQGIDHILIDEAQDTSPAQWNVIEALFDEYLSGDGARADRGDNQRSFFAVGDMKQSIYSFQGADAGLFKQKEHDLGEKLSGVTTFSNVRLDLSFRTTEPVLAFVDALFIPDEAREGLGETEALTHRANRTGEAGLVEIWPLTPRPDTPKTNPWDAPVDTPSEDHPSRALSKKIAQTISGWLTTNEQLASKGRAIQPGDIMILVQNRGALFDEVIHAMAHAKIPVAGADRIKLLEDPAVEDLISFGRCVLSPFDDLSLAEILKSPLFGFDDDADLFPIAHSRPHGQSLWGALRKRCSEHIHWQEAVDAITTARTIALRQGPYTFFSHIIETGEPSGRKRFYQRLSTASRDAIDEMLRQALAFENSNPRSLQSFIHWFEENAGEIKREMDRSNDAVRVMTVHGAKGLEANIVFLIDAHRSANTKQIGPVLKISEPEQNEPGDLCVLTGGSLNDIDITSAARASLKRKAYEEYRRLLYVAATRARDRLYICGIEQGNTKNPSEKAIGEKTWHALAEDAFDALGDRTETLPDPFWNSDTAHGRRVGCAQIKEPEKTDQESALTAVETPQWFYSPAATEKPPMQLAPSRLADDEEVEAGFPATAPAVTPTAVDKYFRGRTLHRLLELLPEVNEGERKDAAINLLQKIAPQIDKPERAIWADEVLTILSDEAFADVFGPGSRAEVSIAGSPKGAKHGLTISGQIDRLVIRDKEILVVDFKTNRPPPKTVEETSPSYVAQMAAYRALLQEIYPAYQIKSALLWTFEARLTPLPDAMLDHAFARYLAAG